MSARAAWRLEQLGFEQVYDYVASKADWFACGMPREGAAADVPWAGDLVSDHGTTCDPGDRVGEVREHVLGSRYDFAVVLNEEGVVLGLLRGDALTKNESARVDDVMELGPKTTPPSEPVEDLLKARSSQGVKHFLVATSHGVFLGILDREDSERALEKLRRQRPDSGSDQR